MRTDLEYTIAYRISMLNTIPDFIILYIKKHLQKTLQVFSTEIVRLFHTYRSKLSPHVSSSFGEWYNVRLPENIRSIIVAWCKTQGSVIYISNLILETNTRHSHHEIYSWSATAASVMNINSICRKYGRGVKIQFLITYDMWILALNHRCIPSFTFYSRLRQWQQATLLFGTIVDSSSHAISLWYPPGAPFTNIKCQVYVYIKRVLKCYIVRH